MNTHALILAAVAATSIATAHSFTLSCTLISVGTVITPRRQPSARTMAVVGTPLIGRSSGENVTPHLGPVPRPVAGDSCHADRDKSGSLDFFGRLRFKNEFAAGCP